MRWGLVTYYPGSPLAPESLFFKAVQEAKVAYVCVSRFEIRVPRWVRVAYEVVFAEGNAWWYIDLRAFLIVCRVDVGTTVPQKALVSALRLGGRTAAMQLVDSARGTS